MAEDTNVERMRQGYEAFQSGNLDSVKEFLAEDVVWHVPGNNPFSGDYKGRDDVISFFARSMQETEGTLRVELHDVLANVEHGVGLVRVTAERGGKKLDARGANVFHLDDQGRATEVWTLTEDSAQADDFWS
jgi:ketosteroid isomerase-like protein